MKQIAKCADAGLANVLEKARFLKQLTKQVHQYCEQDLIPHCFVANLRDGILVIMAENAAWATLLRYQKSSLLQRLRSEAKLHSLRNIEIKVAEAPLNATLKSHTQKTMVMPDPEVLQQTIDSLASDDLKLVLKKFLPKG